MQRVSTSASAAVNCPRRSALGSRASAVFMARYVRTWTVDTIWCRLEICQLSQATVPQVTPPFDTKERFSHRDAGSPIFGT